MFITLTTIGPFRNASRCGRLLPVKFIVPVPSEGEPTASAMNWQWWRVLGERLMKTVLMTISVLSMSFMLASCATEPKTAVLGQAPSGSIEEEQSKYYMDALTQEAFREVEPIIQAIKPGEAIDSTGIDWRFYTIKKRFPSQ